MKVVVVSEYTKPEQNSTGYFWEKVINKLLLANYDVHIISTNDQYDSKSRKNIVFRTIRKAVTSIQLALKTTMHVNKRPIILSGTNPEILFLLLAILRKLVQFQWNVIVHDVFPDNARVASVVDKNSTLYKVLMTSFSWAYKRPDRLFVIGRDMQKVLEKKGATPDKIVFLPNWVDANEITPINKQKSKIIEKLNWQNMVVFLFFGNLGRLQDIPNILSAIDQVKSENSVFLFAGDGVEKEHVLRYINDAKNNRVAYIGDIQTNRRNEVLSSCDVAIVSLKKNMYGLGVPSKAYFSLAADRPILSVMDDGSEISTMVVDENIGWHCAPDNPVELAKIIDQICKSDLSVYKGIPRKLILEKYSSEIILDRLVSYI